MIVAESIEEAQKILEDHAIKCENGFIARSMGKEISNCGQVTLEEFCRSTVDQRMWMFKNFIFYADSFEEVLEIKNISGVPRVENALHDS